MASIAEVVNISVHYERSSEHGVCTEQSNELILHVELSDAVFSSSDVSEVTNVSLFSSWAAMSLAEWVPMWTSGLAALSKIAELVNVESMQSWCKAFNGAPDSALLALSVRELDKARNARSAIRVHDANCVQRVSFHVDYFKL